MYDVTDYSGTNDKPGMYFKYTFLRVLEGEAYEVILYAFSEQDARAEYKELYEVEAGELIRRENW